MSARPPHPVAQRRTAQGWSQQDLAERSGVPRSSVSGIESRRLIPSVTAALALARALGCSVEEVFAADPVPDGDPDWAWPPAPTGCRYWEAEVGARRWLYPIEANPVSLVAHDGVQRAGVLRDAASAPPPPTLVMATCDPTAPLLAAAYERASGFRMIVLARNGRTALDLLRTGRVHVAALHHATDAHPHLNLEAARALLGGDARLVRAAHWVEGLALPVETDRRSVRSAMTRSKTWALREPGAAARDCLDELAGGHPTQGRVVGSHLAVAEAVRAGWADAGVCVQVAAEEAGLTFVPVRREALDLCFLARDARDRRVLALLRLLRSRAHRRVVSELPGYDARETGTSLSAG